PFRPVCFGGHVAKGFFICPPEVPVFPTVVGSHASLVKPHMVEVWKLVKYQIFKPFSPMRIGIDEIHKMLKNTKGKEWTGPIVRIAEILKPGKFVFCRKTG